MTIGELIRRRREELGLSRKELAELSNVPASTLQDIEIGKSIPGADKIKKLAIALECTADALLFDDDEMTDETELNTLLREIAQFKGQDKEMAKKVIKALIIQHRVQI